MIPTLLRKLDPLCLIKDTQNVTGNQWIALLLPEQLPVAAQQLLDTGHHLEDIAGVDAKEGILVIYCFDHAERPCRISLRILIPYESPVLPSIAHIYQGADWHEREAMDFYCIIFEGHPNPIPLLLPGDMAGCPMRKPAVGRIALRNLSPGPAGAIICKRPEFTLLDDEVLQAAAAPAEKPAVAPRPETPAAGSQEG